MKYYSEKLNKIYDSVDELKKAEQKFEARDVIVENLKKEIKSLKQDFEDAVLDAHDILKEINAKEKELRKYEKKNYDYIVVLLIEKRFRFYLLSVGVTQCTIIKDSLHQTFRRYSFSRGCHNNVQRITKSSIIIYNDRRCYY